MAEFRWTAWQSVKHQFFDTLMLVGMRDRLRCPKCKAVGTYKPHGGWFDRSWDWATNWKPPPKATYATNRRWICKYCGFNLSTDGEHQCYPNSGTKVWALKDKFSEPTPKERVGDTVWPWRG